MTGHTGRNSDECTKTALRWLQVIIPELEIELCHWHWCWTQCQFCLVVFDGLDSSLRLNMIFLVPWPVAGSWSHLEADPQRGPSMALEAEETPMAEPTCKCTLHHGKFWLVFQPNLLAQPRMLSVPKDILIRHWHAEYEENLWLVLWQQRLIDIDQKFGQNSSHFHAPLRWPVNDDNSLLEPLVHSFDVTLYGHREHVHVHRICPPTLRKDTGDCACSSDYLIASWRVHWLLPAVLPSLKRGNLTIIGMRFSSDGCACQT